MKNIFIFIFLIYSISSFASMSHKSGIGAPPSKAKKELAQACFSEALTSGCHSPREDRHNFRICVRDKMDSFSEECQSFISRLYGRRR